MTPPQLHPKTSAIPAVPLLAILWIASLIILSACNAAPLVRTSTPIPSVSDTRLATSPLGGAALPSVTVPPSPLPAVTIAPTTNNAQPLPTQSATPAPLRTPDGVPISEPLTQYTLKASFNYNRHTLQVEQTIDYLNRTGQPLNDLLLVVEPNRYPGGFKLNTLTVAELAITSFTLQDNQLKISLPAVLANGHRLTLTLAFDLNLPLIPAPSNDIRAAIYGYSARQANLVDWYPFIPPFHISQGWLVHNPWFYGEHQVYEKADFQVELTLLDPPANLSIAAAAPAIPPAGRPLPSNPLNPIPKSVFTFTHPNARNFTLSASPMYLVYATTVGATTITSYAFTFDAVAGRTALNDAAKALEVYNRLFGAYPHPSLTVVEADFHDGMEFDGLYFLSKAFYATYDGTPKGYLTMIGVHETAHQWWYGRVANDQALEPWLDEALATYSELLYYANVYPDFVKWWWSYRVDYFKPAGWVDQRIYDYGGSYPYRDGVYLRGAQFIDQVRQRVGDPAFFAFIKDYAARYQDQIVSAQDFFTTLQEHSPVGLGDLKKDFFKP